MSQLRKITRTVRSPRNRPERPPGRRTARILTLEILEDRILPSVSVTPDPANPGKSIVRFAEDVAGNSDGLTLHLTQGGLLEYSMNGSPFATVQGLTLSAISEIDVSLGSGNDSLTLDTSNGSVIPAPAGIHYDAGAGQDSLAIAQDSDMILTDASLSLSAGGVVYLVAVEQARLTGGNSPNTLDASAFSGSVTLDGGGQTDHLIGGSGNDVLLGLQANDLLEGRGGNDVLYSGNSGSTMFGGDGDDVFFGGTGKDFMYGEAGNDQLYGGNGDDLLDGGTGDDLLDGGNGNDSMAGGAGYDTVQGTGANFTLTDTQMTGLGTDVISGLERGVLTGGTGNNTIDCSAFSGDTVLDGAGGNSDALIGAKGFNILIKPAGEFGNVTMFGGAGANEYRISPQGAVALVEKGGSDTINLGQAGSGVTLNLNLSNGFVQTVDSSGSTMALTGQFEAVTGSAFADTFTGNDAANVIYGGLGSDQLSGGGGADVIYGGVTGTAGDPDNSSNLIYGGLGSDQIYGGSGADVIYGGVTGTAGDPDNSSNLIYGGLGGDQIFGGSGADVIYGGVTGTGADSDTSSNVIYGGLGADQIYGGSGADVIYGGVTGTAGDSDTSSNLIYGGLGGDQIYGASGADVIYGGVLGGSAGSDPDSNLIYGGLGADQITGGGGADVIYGGVNGTGSDPDNSPNLIYGGLGGDQIYGASGADVIFGGLGIPDNSAGGDDAVFGLAGDDILVGGAGNDQLAGGLGNDTYRFVGGNLGSDAIVEAPGEGTDALDFAAFGGPVSVDLARTDAQAVNAGNLTLTLSAATGIENVLGSAYSDTIRGNTLDNQLSGADYLDDRYGGAPGWNGRTQVVLLDFDTQTGIDAFGNPKPEHVYSADERAAVQSIMQADYAGFHFLFTQSAADAQAQSVATGGGGQYASIFFNKTPFEDQGNPQPGGLSSDLDFRNLNLGGSAAVDVNGFLGGANQPDATSANYAAMSATIAAHELGHLSGLRHIDAAGPIGYGTPVLLNSGAFIPAYPGPTTAFETNFHIIASPASVGSSLFDAVANPFFGEREAVKLAFNEGGTTVNEQASAHGSLATAQPLTLVVLGVPNTLRSGLNFGRDFGVAAVDVAGSINLVGGTSETDFYSLAGRAGDLLNLQVMSGSLTRTADAIDSILRVYDAAGNLVAYYTGQAVNDDEPEDRDSFLMDLRLPADGTYYVQVDTFYSADVPHTDTGTYELFVYRFATGNARDQGNVLDGRAGNDTVRGGAGADTLLGGDGTDVLLGAAGNDLLIGGLGADTLNGGTGEDIVIGGTTAYDANQAALDAIMAVWAGSGTYADRVKLLQQGVGATGKIKLTSTTVFGDGAANTLVGGAGMDWFFASKTDGIVDAIAGEQVTKV